LKSKKATPQGSFNVVDFCHSPTGGMADGKIELAAN